MKGPRLAQTIDLQGELAKSVAYAVIASSTTPLLLLDERLVVIAASASFCSTFGIPDEKVVDLSVFAMGDGEWNLPRLRALLEATQSGAADAPAYEIDLATARSGVRRLVLDAHRIVTAIGSENLVLLSVADVTEARATERQKDDLLREKAILLEELQHRVANSLQIIASILMQSARKVQSEETRSHLHNAHMRVISIAEMQRQLAVSRVGDVALRPYLEQLCASISASMIVDADEISLSVDVDDSKVSASISVSLGLIVVELVINALKHAFTGQRSGRIEVSYCGHAPGWTLVVRDDGVGMPADPQDAKAGLGTSIVQALARQLRAGIVVSDGSPGAVVTVVHPNIADGDAESLPEVEAV